MIFKIGEKVAEKDDFGSCFRAPFPRTQPAALRPQAPSVQGFLLSLHGTHRSALVLALHRLSSIYLATRHDESSNLCPFLSFSEAKFTPGLCPRLPAGFGRKEQPEMAEKRKTSSLDTPTCDLSAASPIALTAPRRSQRETAVSDDDVESYQLQSHQLEVPVVLMQDSIAGLEPVDLEPIPESVL
jgi:hypothetical protein